MGIGKWGVLLREYLEVFPHWRFYQSEWQLNIEGIEIHRKYQNAVWGTYNKFYVGDAVTILMNMPVAKRYDLAIMVDVLEHFNQQTGRFMLQLLRKKARHVIVSYSNCEQSNVRDNPNEDHLSKWTDADFEPNATKIVGVDGSWGAFLLRPDPEV